MYYGHLGQDDLNLVEVVNGSQRLTQAWRDNAVGVLASMYAAAGLDPAVPAITAASDVFAGYTFYTREAYEARFSSVQLPSPGLSSVSSTGYVVVINVEDLRLFGTTPGRIRVVLAADIAQAATITAPGSEWALLESTPVVAVPAEKKGISPAVIAAGLAAAAVAAVLIFT